MGLLVHAHVAVEDVRVQEIDLDRFLDARRVKRETGLITVRLDHELQRVAKLSPTFAQGAAVGQCAGYFFDPAEIRAAVTELDDRVITLLHGEPILDCGGGVGQGKVAR